MTVVDPEPTRREKCACRMEVNGLVDLDSENKIKMCPVHAAAFQMFKALRRIRIEAGKAFDEVSDQTSAGRDARTIFTKLAKLSEPAIALAEKGTP